MNNKRRKRIQDVALKLEIIKNELYEIEVEEEGTFDSMPEGLQYSERGILSEESIDVMNENIDKIDEIIEELNSISL